jgi:hypothetical protein
MILQVRNQDMRLGGLLDEKVVQKTYSECSHHYQWTGPSSLLPRCWQIAQIQGPGLEGATNLNFKKRIGLSCETLLPAAIALT